MPTDLVIWGALIFFAGVGIGVFAVSILVAGRGREWKEAYLSIRRALYRESDGRWGVSVSDIRRAAALAEFEEVERPWGTE